MSKEEPIRKTWARRSERRNSEDIGWAIRKDLRDLPDIPMFPLELRTSALIVGRYRWQTSQLMLKYRVS